MKTKYFFLYLILFTTNIVGQNSKNVTSVIPPIPEIAAFAKQIEFPIGLQTGIPEISVPIYSIVDKIKLPITLSYNASGIKVEENATWVGLGWNLDCGGSLSRIVKGLPDDLDNIGYMYTPYTTTFIKNLSINDPLYFNLLFNQVFNGGSLDVEPDIYFFSAGGYSGKFYYSRLTNKFELVPYQNVKIEHTVSSGRITSFLITIPDGTKYFFGKSADNSQQAYDTYQSQVSYFQSGGAWQISSSNNNIPTHIVSWKLLNIQKENDLISFHYSNQYTSTDHNRIGETRDFKGQSGCESLNSNSIPITSMSIQESLKTRLEKISYKNTTIEFLISNTRRLDTYGIEYSLDMIRVKNSNDRIIQSTQLKYTYAESNDNTSWGISNSDVLKKRLVLKEIKENNQQSSQNPPYIFEYDGVEELPNKLSKSQDYWGYYNGKNNITLIPTLPLQILNSNGAGYIDGADRTVDFSYAKKGSLIKITYPTGGETLFEYESNTISPNYINVLNGFQLSGLSNNCINFFKSSLFQSNNNNNLYVTQFSVNSVDNQIHVTSFLEGCDPETLNLDCPLDIKIIGISNPSFVQQVRASNFFLNLPNGLYKIEAVVNANTTYPNPDFNVQISWKENPNPNSLIIGGLRAKKIIKKDNLGSLLIKKYNYNTHSNINNSSGLAYNTPVHNYNIFCGTLEIHPSVLRVVSNSVLPLASIDGKQITYGNVTEFYEGLNADLKNEYVFDQVNYIPFSQQTWEYPYAPDLVATWRSGILMKKSIFLRDGANYKLLESEENNYSVFNSSYTLNTGIVVGSYPTQNTFGINTYGIYNEWYLLTNKKNKYYSDNIVTENNINYSYDNYFQIKTQTSTNSKNETITTTYNYPYNFSGIPVYDNMVSKNMIAEPIEIKKVNTTLSNKVLDWQKNHYLFVNGNNPVLKWIDRYNTSTGQFNTEVTYYKHDAALNIQQLTPKTGPTKSYIWDANSTNPIAEVTNAKHNEIFHYNFEDNGNDWDWNFDGYDNSKSKTGKQSGKIYNPNPWEKVSHSNNWLQISNTTTKKYRYSVWVYSTSSSAEVFLFMKTATEQGYFTYVAAQHTSQQNKWVLLEGEYDVPASITQLSIRLDNNGSGTVWFDDVRLYPTDAMMTTYTYEPLIGISSQTDVNNKSSYYFYDAFNRLSLVKDKDGNVLKRICYNYQGQPEVCYTTPTPPQPQTIYARLSYENYWWSWPYLYGDIVVRFYADAAGTIPLNVNNVQVSVNGYDCNNNNSYQGNNNANGNTVTLISGALITEYYYDWWTDNWYDCNYSYVLGNGNYVIIP